MFEEGNILYYSPLLLRTTGITILTVTLCLAMSAEHGVVNVVIVGHSFVRRLALSAGELNMRLNRGDCAVTFISRSGMRLAQLRSQFDDIVSRGPHVLYMEIGCIDISGQDPLSLAAEVFDLAWSFFSRGVCRVVIGQIFSRNLAAGRPDSRVAHNFNERMVAYNLRMRELTPRKSHLSFEPRQPSSRVVRDITCPLSISFRFRRHDRLILTVV